METQFTIEQKLNLIGWDRSQKLLADKLINLIPSLLSPDEILEHIIPVSYQNQTGVLICTDQRVGFIDKSMLQSKPMSSYLFNQISNLKATFGELHILSANGDIITFKNIPDKLAQSFANYVSAKTNNVAPFELKTNSKNPNWPPKAKKGLKWWQVFGLVVFILFIIGLLNGNHDNNSTIPSKQDSLSTDNVENSQSHSNQVGVGETLKSDMFEITVNKVEIVNRVNTHNEFTDLEPESNILYLVLNVTFKNIDNESRMPFDGSILINYNGKDYNFDKSEVILAKGFGLFLDQINPLTSKTTKLVYKIPAELKGDIYWHPGRTNEDQTILLGKL